MSIEKRRVARHPRVFCARVPAKSQNGAFWYLVKHPKWGFDVYFSHGTGGYHKFTYKRALKLLRSLNPDTAVDYGTCSCTNHKKRPQAPNA